jgi:hypothetical protein
MSMSVKISARGGRCGGGGWRYWPNLKEENI